MAGKKKQPGFEEAAAEFEQIIAKMEQGDLSLEESLKLYEQGVSLTRVCAKELQTAQLKMEELKAGKKDETV